MSQKTEVITIAGREVTVSEISVSRIYRLLQGEDSILSLPLPEAMEKVKGLVPLALDTDIAELLEGDIFSEDIDNLVAAFKRTNPIFFKIAGTLQLEGALADLIRTLLRNFSTTFAALSQQGTGSPSGDMATGISAAA